MKNKYIVISMRISRDMQEKLTFLRQRKFNINPYFREAMGEDLNEKCKEFQYIESDNYCPF